MSRRVRVVAQAYKCTKSLCRLLVPAGLVAANARIDHVIHDKSHVVNDLFFGRYGTLRSGLRAQYGASEA
jgi:hypothetical protein